MVVSTLVELLYSNTGQQAAIHEIIAAGAKPGFVGCEKGCQLRYFFAETFKIASVDSFIRARS